MRHTLAEVVCSERSSLITVQFKARCGGDRHVRLAPPIAAIHPYGAPSLWSLWLTVQPGPVRVHCSSAACSLVNLQASHAPIHTPTIYCTLASRFVMFLLIGSNRRSPGADWDEVEAWGWECEGRVSLRREVRLRCCSSPSESCIAIYCRKRFVWSCYYLLGLVACQGEWPGARRAPAVGRTSEMPTVSINDFGAFRDETLKTRR
jgi:hypothetical protein